MVQLSTTALAVVSQAGSSGVRSAMIPAIRARIANTMFDSIVR